MLTMGLLPTGSVAAGETARSIEFSVRAGLVISDQDYDYDDAAFSFDPRSSIGAALAVDVSWPLTCSFAMRGEVMYIRKGSEVKVLNTTVGGVIGGGNHPAELKDAIDYLAIAPLATASLSAGRFRPYVLAGPRLDIKLGGDSELNAVTSDGLESTIWGLTVGLGCTLKLSDTRSVLCEVQYHRDLTDAYDLAIVDVRNRAVVFLVGLTL